MLLSEIGDKEIIDMKKGSMHGRLWDAEMLFDEISGKIISLTVPYSNDIGGRFSSNINLPWESIVMIGEDIILFKEKN